MAETEIGRAYRLPDGTVMMPMRAAEDGTVGDGWLPIMYDHPEYDAWVRDINQSRLENSADAADRFIGGQDGSDPPVAVPPQSNSGDFTSS